MELDAIFEEARRLLPASDEALRTALLARARIFNYIPPKAEGDYADVIATFGNAGGGDAPLVGFCTVDCTGAPGRTG